MASITVENYLKHILLLSEDSAGLVPMGALAEALAVVPGTVTTMVKAMTDEGLTEHRPRHGVRLQRARGQRPTRRRLPAADAGCLPIADTLPMLISSP